MGDHVATQSPKSAALQTLWTGFGIDAAVAIGAGTLILIDGGDVMSPLFWTSMGGLVVKSVLTSAASYLVRLKVAQA